MPSRHETLEAYVGAWNTTDEAECRRLLERSWADTATYTDPSIHLQGRDALVAHCVELTERRKGAKAIITVTSTVTTTWPGSAGRSWVRTDRGYGLDWTSPSSDPRAT